LVGLIFWILSSIIYLYKYISFEATNRTDTLIHKLRAKRRNGQFKQDEKLFKPSSKVAKTEGTLLVK